METTTKQETVCMGERQEMLGRHMELRQARSRCELACEAMRDKLRVLLPVGEGVERLDRDAILNTAAALHSQLAQIAEQDIRLAALGRELGI
ncbi:hypothetical protein LJC23_04325 [Desulfovibrio sp. OttesenSCG-928-I05]|nr:hypothetical protein [Desulfovibrio sp. OttesenSCG-928-I05]